MSLRVALSPETAVVAHTCEVENLSTLVSKTKKSKRFVQPATQVKPALKVWRVKSKRIYKTCRTPEKMEQTIPQFFARQRAKTAVNRSA